jgi:hypothetical protein
VLIYHRFSRHRHYPVRIQDVQHLDVWEFGVELDKERINGMPLEVMGAVVLLPLVKLCLLVLISNLCHRLTLSILFLDVWA